MSAARAQRPIVLEAERGALTEPLLDAAEAARLLHIPRSTLYELVRSRGLPHIRIGDRGMRFTRQGLEEWVNSHTYGVQPRNRS